ncbi:MAG: methyltransferase domain-containing protein, partial [Lachnospiraceae bacterium]|nr:methyltransferase domain-containing protein [Lachnospiraceae bacterium]
RMGVYQLLLTDAPSYAVCKESVNLAGKRGFKGLGGFVNGVLRGISRETESSVFKDDERYLAFVKDELSADDKRSLCIKYSVPELIADEFIKDYGDRASSILEAMMKTRDVSIRFRSTLKDDELEKAAEDMRAAGVVLRRSGDIPYVYQASHTGDIRKLPGYDEGLFNVQDISSCKAVMALGIQAGDNVIDCCAAPGGKTVLASELAGKDGTVTSCDISEAKADLIRENIGRLGCGNVKVLVRDASVNVPGDNGRYDKIILDVPCSGLGILGKKRDIKYNLTEEGLESLITLQRRIIDGCVPYLKEGGKLLYSTCTVRKAENGEQVRYITEKYGLKTAEGPVQLLPDEEEQDGFFYCVLEKI